MAGGSFVLNIFFVKMFFQNGADQLIQTALCHKFITCLFARKRTGQPVDDRPDMRTDFGQQCVDDDLVIRDVLYGPGTGMVVFHEDLEVEYNTVIDTGVIFWVSAVERTVCDKDHVSLMIGIGVIVKRKMKSAGENVYDLIMAVPVIRHIIPGTVGHLMIESDREIKGSLLSLFIIIQIFH